MSKAILKKLLPTEFEEQRDLFTWASMRPAWPELKGLFAIPNGGYLLSKAAAGKLKAAGLKKGYPDIGLDVARGGYHGLRIELKRQRGGSVAPEQKEWHERLKEQGYCVHVCNGWQQAAAIIIEYLSGRLTPITN